MLANGSWVELQQLKQVMFCLMRLDNISLVCPVCGNTFVTSRYKGSQTCSRSCGTRLGHQLRK